MEKSGRHFVLVHGAGHGAWCWYRVETLLRAAGHRVTALDLAASGINPKQLYELHTISDYLEPLLSFMAALPSEERIVLVGHSAGGTAISVAIERFPQKVAVAVFATAAMPGPDLTVQDISDKDLTLGVLLVRPHPCFYDVKSTTDTTFTEENYGSVHRIFIVCSQDQSTPKDIQMWMIKNNPPDEVKIIDTDHMVMFSKPHDLSSDLQEIADKYY